MKTQLNSLKTGLVIIGVALIFACQAVEADVIYVSSGQSIQAAIEAAKNGDEIEVAPGTYNEAINFLTRAVRLYSSGGPTVTTINGAGHYHVVQCILGEGSDTILEGFTIRGGNANGSTDPAKRGGGMYNSSSSPTVINCIFTANSAVQGGGMYNTSSSPTVTNCTFTTNTASSHGGGMYNTASSPTLTDCTFSSNSAYIGGGIFNYYNSITLIRCTFTANTATIDGGGMYNAGGSSAITDCTFSSNNADYGGGMYNIYSASPTVTNCVFLNNNAPGLSAGWRGGGGMLNQTYAAPTVINCLFRGNTEYGICNLGYGGTPSIATVTNCILWGDTPGEIYNNGGSATITYSDVQGGYPGGNINEDPLFLNAAGGDFRFVSSDSPCVDTGDNSVVTEATDLAGNPRIVDGDWDGSAIVDMGIYELQPQEIHNITQDIWYERIQTAITDSDNADQIEVGPGTYNESINFSGLAIELYSSNGPEVTTIDATDLNASVVTCKSGEGPDTILEGFTLTGGSGSVVSSYKFGGGMYNLNSSPTVTDCIFTINSVSGDGGGMYNNNSHPTVTYCLFLENSAAYAGGGVDNRTGSHPTVSHCTFDQNTAGSYGGGMENFSNAHAIVTNCTFSGNTSNTHGGGMYNNSSSPAVTECTFIQNETVGFGGGMLNSVNCSPTVTKCTFDDNTAGNGGGMFNNDNCNPTVTNCAFNGNTAVTYGGGIQNSKNSKPTVTNCIFNQNIAQTNLGGGMANYSGSHAIVKNCTFSGNSAIGGGGIRNYSSSPTVTNCILWDNQPDEISSQSSSPAISYCDIQDWIGGTGNINADPNFVDADNPDPELVNLRLNPDSPCIDAGNTAAVTAGVFADLDGNTRVVDDPTKPDIGNPVLGMPVDMGAYEFNPCVIEGDINCDGQVDLFDWCIFCQHWLDGIGTS